MQLNHLRAIMKKITLLLAALVVVLTSCEQKNNSQQNNPKQSNLASQQDFLYVEKGEIYFYNLDTREATLYPSEPDSVTDALCSKNNVLYYNVAKDGKLLLKSLDLNTANPMPEFLADWNVPVEKDEWDGMPTFGDMFFSYDETQIGLERDLHWFAGKSNNLAVYDLASKTVNKYDLYHVVELEDGCFTVEDLPDESGFDRWGVHVSHKAEKTVFEIDDHVYYVGDGGRTCLDDKIDFEETMGFSLDDGYDLTVIGEDPTGKKALIAVYMAIGDGEVGFYIVSTLDGKEQRELPGSAYDVNGPVWLSDGSLLYFGYLDKEGLLLMEPDNMIRYIAESDIFCVLH